MPGSAAGQFDELVERQLGLFASDESALLAEADEAESAWIRSGRDNAEEAYGDYQLVVDAIADSLLEIRDAYASDTVRGQGRRVSARVQRRRQAPLRALRVARLGRRIGVIRVDALFRRPGPERARQLQVRGRLLVPALVPKGTTERVMRVVVGGRDVEHLPELRLRLGPAHDPEVRDPSASRMDALSGSSRFAFSRATVACAGIPSRRWLRPC